MYTKNLIKFEYNFLNTLSANFTKWSNTLKQFVGNLPTNCLSVFDHFVGLAHKGLTSLNTNTYIIPDYVLIIMYQSHCNKVPIKLNPFLANVPILYLLKTPENLWFCGAFRGYKMGIFVRNGLTV